MNFFKAYLKKRAIKKILKRVPGFLRRSYGKSKTYTPGQVRTAIKSTGCNIDYACYAYAAFCTRERFDSFHMETGEDCDYDHMQQEIGDLCFNGNTNFSDSDLSYYSSSFEDGFGAGGIDGGGSSGDET